MRFISLVLLFAIFSVFSVSAQSSKKMVSSAYQLFKDGEYSEAKLQYEELYNNYNRDAKYNFYYGACLVEVNDDISLAAQCLKYASIKKVNKEVYYYLGRSYQLLYEFDIAIENYQKYIKVAGITGRFKEAAQKYIAECEVGKGLAAKIYKLNVLAKDTCFADELLKYYHPVPDVGQVMKNNDFFESGIDPEGIMFLTERGDLVFYTLKNSASADWDLHKMEKLIDGWSESALLGGEANTRYNELYPMLHTDGVTLYFSSDRPGGLGGYDIYKATYDTEKKSFSNVTNMGIPFNSPLDDYFFVCDDFSGQAWFTSNRQSSNKQATVYSIQWDETVIKSRVLDNNEVKRAAQLPLSANAEKSISESGVVVNSKHIAEAKKAEGLFRFSVADTLEYTRFEHFKSDYALGVFKKGYYLEHERDSLAQKMKEKRRLYGITENEDDRNKLVNEILVLEKQTYSLDSKIDDHYYQAQKSEQDKIRELVHLGKYNSTSEVRAEPKEEFSLQNITFPDDLSVYGDDDFGRHLKALKEMYDQLFVDDEVKKLVFSDSLFAWGNVLNIESSRMLEKASQTATPVVVKMPIPFKSKTEIVEEETPESLVKQARSLKLDALKLYHQALDTKYSIYRNKFRDIKSVFMQGDSFEQTMSYAGEAMTYFKAGDELINKSLVGVDLETFEKAGALKRNAVLSQEKGLFYYLEVKSGEEDTASKTKDVPNSGVVAPSYAEIHKGKDVTLSSNNSRPVESVKTGMPTNTPDDIVAQALSKKAESANSLFYKIQIGVFRNQPDPDMLSALNDVTSDVILESGLMKYYSGNFKSYDEAISKVAAVRESGFEGAFVVAFFNGKQIPVSKAREQQLND